MVGKVLYWVAIVAVSLALVVGLILFFEARDRGSLNNPGASAPWPRALLA